MTTITIFGLEENIQYEFSLTATNSAGTSQPAMHTVTTLSTSKQKILLLKIFNDVSVFKVQVKLLLHQHWMGVVPLVSQSHGTENLVFHVMDQTDFIQLDILRQDLLKYYLQVMWPLTAEHTLPVL